MHWFTNNQQLDKHEGKHEVIVCDYIVLLNLFASFLLFSLRFELRFELLATLLAAELEREEMEDSVVVGVDRVGSSSADVSLSILASIETHRAAVGRERRKVDSGGERRGEGLVLARKWWLA